MPNPIINPVAPGAYTVTNSGFVALDVNLTDIHEETALILLTIPPGAQVAVLRNPANWSGAGTSILSGGAWTVAPVALGDWQVSVMPGAVVTDQATVHVASGTSSAGGLLRILITNLADQAVSAERGSGTVSIDRVLADPNIVNIQVSSGLPVREKDDVTISASVSAAVVQNGTPGTPLPALPPVLSSWSEVAGNPHSVNIEPPMGLTAPMGLTGPTATFKAPAVEAPTDLDFTITAALDLNNDGVMDPNEPQSAEQLQVDIETVRYGMVLILDRSGSMGSFLGGRTMGPSKWAVAVQAAHAWADLFRAFRPGGHHLAGVITFEHDTCSWVPTPAGDIAFRNPANASAVAGLQPLNNLGNVNTWNLGTVQSCTPIGDALVKAWEGINSALGPNDKGAVMLLTDGYENSGRVTIASTQGLAATTFAAERISALSVPNDIIGNRVYTLAIGSTVDEDRLNDLGSAVYRKVASELKEIAPAFLEMLSHVLDAEKMTAGPLVAIDPDSPANSLYYPQPAKEHVVAFLVTWKSITDRLHISWREQGTSGPFEEVNPSHPAVTEIRRGTHGLTRVDLKALFSPDPVPAVDWRLQHKNNAGNIQMLSADDAVAIKDLFTKVEVSFDQRQYFIGDAIKLSCRIRSGGVAVTNATVGVDCARPGEGLGTFLTNHADRYKQLKPTQQGPDPDQGKGLMFKTLINALEKQDLPIVTPPQFTLLDDGAHGDGLAGDGHFANAYTETEKEGTYTFRFRITGALADGSRFSSTFTRSTWVGVRPDPNLLGSIWGTLDSTVDGQVVSVLTFTPRTATNEFLGPYRTGEIQLTAHNGRLDGPLIDNINGSYSQRVAHPKGADPIVAIDIYGQPMKPTSPAIESAGKHDTNCWRIWRQAILCTLRRIWRFFFGRRDVR
jgi:hypothetical protein